MQRKHQSKEVAVTQEAYLMQAMAQTKGMFQDNDIESKKPGATHAEQQESKKARAADVPCQSKNINTAKVAYLYQAEKDHEATPGTSVLLTTNQLDALLATTADDDLDNHAKQGIHFASKSKHASARPGSHPMKVAQDADLDKKTEQDIGNGSTTVKDFELGHLTLLEWLDLSNLTMLTGSIPSELALMSSLLYLDLSGSSGLFGTIPAAFCNLQNLSCTFLDYQGYSYNCTLAFDCTDILCGCDCPCFSGRGATSVNNRTDELAMPFMGNASM